MPLYSYECSYCFKQFDEIKDYKKSGRTFCIRCGNTAFKIPAVFTPRIFKKREFADGTTTPDYVTNHKLEKAWMKSEGITYEPPSQINFEYNKKQKRKKDTETSMSNAFAEAYKKTSQGYKIEKLEHKKIKKENFAV